MGRWLFLTVVGGCGASARPSATPAPHTAAPAEPVRLSLEPSFEVDSEEVSFEAAGVTVRGTVVRPRALGRFGAALLVAGSGPTDRNWESPQIPGTNGSGRLLAEALARHGLVVLRYDKRGSGETPLGGSLTWADYVAEQRAAIALLRHDRGVDPEVLFLVGHGEGALQVLHLAGQPGIDPTAIVLFACPGRTVQELALAWGDAALREGGGAGPSEQEQLQALHDALRAIGRGEVPDLSPLDPRVATLVTAFADPRAIGFNRELLSFDPARALAELDVPTVLLHGARDVEVDPDVDRRALRRAERAGISDYLLRNSDHVFKYEGRIRSSLGPSAGARYNATDRSLDPEVVPTLVRMLVDLDPERLHAGRGEDFGAVSWPSLRALQCAVSTRRSEDALREAAALEGHVLHPAEEMWRALYRAIALDQLGRREEAIAAYREARSWYPHAMTGLGLFQPLVSLRHLDRMQNDCGGRPTSPPVTNAEAFASLRHAIDESYSYRDRLGLDWPALLERHRAGMVDAASPRAFADEAGLLLAEAKDPHIQVEVDGVTLHPFAPAPSANFDRGVVGRRVTGLVQRGGCLETGRVGDLGYALFSSWKNDCPRVGVRFQEALEQDLAGTTGLVIDVRPNGGGNEDLAKAVAGHFLGTRTLYAMQEVRAQGRPTYERRTRTLEPVEPRYTEPVVVLMGRANMSSNEAFLLMMRAAGAKLVGERSFGSSGNPQPVDLGNGVVVKLPSWRALLPDGAPLEGVGIVPDRVVTARVTPRRDPVLDAAVAILRRR